MQATLTEEALIEVTLVVKIVSISLHEGQGSRTIDSTKDCLGVSSAICNLKVKGRVWTTITTLQTVRK